MDDPDKPNTMFEALHIPPSALEQGGVEVLRAAIVDGGLHVSLRRAFDEPDAWGLLIADIARHIARIYAKETTMSEDEVLDLVRATFESEMDAPSDPGSTTAMS
jgi:hypothetical protein